MEKHLLGPLPILNGLVCFLKRCCPFLLVAVTLGVRMSRLFVGSPAGALGHAAVNVGPEVSGHLPSLL